MTRPPITLVRRTVFVLSLVPAAALVYGFFGGNLSANPVDYLTDQTGDWALIFLVASLAVTPVRRLTGWNELVRLRRTLGLFAFSYAAAHLIVWVTLVSFFDVPTMIEDVTMRPFITVGMATFAILLALAVTSNTASIRRLGRRWTTLHRLAYLAAIGGVVHFWWLVKADVTRPRRYAVVLAVLLAFRVWWSYRSRPSPARVASRP